MSETEKKIVELTQTLLDAIAGCDFATYRKLCDDSLTAFEPEARGQLVHGLPFHQFYFDNTPSNETASQTTIVAPHVRLLEEHVAVISYIRLQQRVNENGIPHTSRCEETRVWHHQNNQWKHVHFHRSESQ